MFITPWPHSLMEFEDRFVTRPNENAIHYGLAYCNVKLLCCGYNHGTKTCEGLIFWGEFHHCQNWVGHIIFDAIDLFPV